MLRYYFTYSSELPAEAGFPMFGAAHLLWLLAGTALTVLLAFVYSRAVRKEKNAKPLFAEEKKGTDASHGYSGRKLSGSRRMDLGIGIFLMALLVIREIFLAAAGHLTVYELPLHLCSMAGILCFVHSLKNPDWMGQVLYALCLPGTVVALIFPDWVMYPPIHFITIQGFFFHFGVALYVICQLLSGRIRPSIRRLWKVFVFLAIVVPPIYFLNRLWNTNYFFVHYPSPGSPLEWIESFMGNPGYLIGYGVLAIVITSLMELGYLLIQKIRKSGTGIRKEEQ